MSQLDNIEAIERRLWSSADNLRANSNYASNEYFLPVMGLIFLRHAYSRFLAVRDLVVPTLPTRGGVARPLAKEDFSRRGAIFLRPEAQFPHLVGLPDGEHRPGAIVAAMESIEEDYATLRGVLPKDEYHELDNAVLGQLLRTFNDPALERATGDVFGRIYEYFLTQFADQKAHDGGEFFTPVALVTLIANIIEPDHGAVIDPACGSGGMFVQSAHFIEAAATRAAAPPATDVKGAGAKGTVAKGAGRKAAETQATAAEHVTFYGMEKNATTIRLAKMNLAVHGLEGAIERAITYYEDPHTLAGRADFVMANPPFNVDEVDAEKVKNDPRLPFGLPGTNKKGSVPNGNYLWISYFYSYLNERGRAGFVMSSQASSAGREEGVVRRKLVETGAVDTMVAIRSNFFYTRTVPCELWFLDRGKPEERRDTVLMIDARNIYRKVTRKIFDFSPEHLKNITAITWLYRGQRERFDELVLGYIADSLDAATGCGIPNDALAAALDALLATMRPFLDAQPAAGPQAETLAELTEARSLWATDVEGLRDEAAASSHGWAGAQFVGAPGSAGGLHAAAELAAPLAVRSRDLAKAADHLVKLAARLIEICEKELDARKHDLYKGADVGRARRALEEARGNTAGALRPVRYLHRQAAWLLERFPDAALRDVPGLVRVVTRAELAENDWSLTPGRYVGVAPAEEDEDFDFEETMRTIHTELADLNAEAVALAERIAKNFEEMGI